MDCISNLRFADDVLLITSSLLQLKKMVTDFKRSTERIGPEIQLEKTNVLCIQKANRKRNANRQHQCRNLISNRDMGQTMTFEQHETIEIKNSIRIAWPSFAKHRQA